METRFRYNEHGKIVGLDWDFHNDGKSGVSKEYVEKVNKLSRAANRKVRLPKTSEGMTPTELRYATRKPHHCLSGHDLRGDNTITKDGRCVECKRANNQRAVMRRREREFAKGGCAEGHSYESVEDVTSQGRCRECGRISSIEALRRRRKRV